MPDKVIGGQAVIEGVMMLSSSRVAVAVRKPNSKIVVKKQRFVSLKKRFGFLRLPFFRGVISLYETLAVGIKALFYSANEAVGDDEKISRKEIIFSVFFAVLFAILLFIALPFYLTTFITKEATFLFNLIDGVIRISVFFTYLAVISLFRDVRVMFQYHGAEHKAVNAYEDKKALTVENIKKYSALHPRCGTSFLLIVLILAVFVFSLVPNEGWLVRIGVRIVLLPVIAAFAYEFLKLGDKFRKNILVKSLILPGLLLQKMTTKEPNNKQIEVAIAALKAVR
jgi:uncharacterized protein YqhQ